MKIKHKHLAFVVFGTTLIMLIAVLVMRHSSVTKPVCYNGYMYNVDSRGVMWPNRGKGGIVTQCSPTARVA